jgi:hypothetical protein
MGRGERERDVPPPTAAWVIIRPSSSSGDVTGRLYVSGEMLVAHRPPSQPPPLAYSQSLSHNTLILSALCALSLRSSQTDHWVNASTRHTQVLSHTSRCGGPGSLTAAPGRGAGDTPDQLGR